MLRHHSFHLMINIIDSIITPRATSANSKCCLIKVNTRMEYPINTALSLSYPLNKHTEQTDEPIAVARLVHWRPTNDINFYKFFLIVNNLKNAST